MNPDEAVEVALLALGGVRQARNEAATSVPNVPGLYAFYGDGVACADLGLPSAAADEPLYVGKAEKSLNGRDVRTHFATGKTGSSTVRRSLAALLVDRLGLVAVPRNLAKPDGSASFSLEADGDLRLSEWMDQRLRLATWEAPAVVVLGTVEKAILGRLRPPLNLDHVGEQRDRLRSARAVLAQNARSWSG